MDTSLDTTVATLWRVESPRVIARLARLVGDVDTAEELAQDAFVAAIEKWRSDGIPNNPAAWLHKTARFLAVDRIRRHDIQHSKYQQIAATSPQTTDVDIDEVVDGDLADDLLGLIFMVCHPILSPDARSALTLKLICGLTTEEVARAFLAPEVTIAQRIVRAKRTLSAANIRFELPGDRAAGATRRRTRGHLPGVQRGTHRDQRRPVDPQRPVRRGAPPGPHAGQPDSARPRDAGTPGLDGAAGLALNARTGPQGEPVLLLDQDRTRWDQLLIRRGLATARSRRRAGRSGRALRPAGRHRRLPRDGPGPPRTPTGSASRRCTTGSPRSARRRWWSSTAPWPPRRHSGRRPGWPSWTPS